MIKKYATKSVYETSNRFLLSALFLLSWNLSSVYATHGNDQDFEPLLVRELPIVRGQTVQLRYMAHPQEGQKNHLEALVRDEHHRTTPVKPYDIPVELRRFKHPHVLDAFMQDMYAKLHTLSNGDIRLSLYQRGRGGGRFHEAAIQGDLDTLNALLQDSTMRFQINEKDCEMTPLHCAVASGQLEASRLLLEHGAEVDSVNAMGMTALHLSAQNQHHEICQLLLAHGASLTAENEEGKTPIQLAAENKDMALLALLVNNPQKRDAFPLSSCLTFQSDITDDAFKRQLENQTHLEKLDLTGCTQISEGTIEWAASEIPTLQELNLRGCTQITDLTVEFVVEYLADSLKKITLDGIPGLKRATFLKIKGANIFFSPEGAADETLDCSQLKKPLNDAELCKLLATRPNLRVLNLKGCRFLTDAGLKHLASLKELEVLDIRGCTRLTKAGFDFIAQNLKLKELQSDTPVTLKPATLPPQTPQPVSALSSPLPFLPLSPPIPPVAQGYEDVYMRFLKGVLIYKPDEKSDKGRIDLPFSALGNLLEGTFDLSACGDTGKYLSINTGYRKGKKAENASKVEIWFTPRFLVEKELNTTAKHFEAIFPKEWPESAPVGIIWTWGGWDEMEWYDYLTTQNMDSIGSENLYKKWRAATTRGVYHQWWPLHNSGNMLHVSFLS